MKPKQARPRGAKKTKPAIHPKAGDRHVEVKQRVPKPAASPTNWVRPTREDLMQSFTPEERKAVEDWIRAVSCPDAQTAKLTPEQKAQRDQYRAEKWPEYDAKMAELHKTHEARVIGGIGAIHARADEDRWFSENTPHQFKSFYHPTIVHFAGLSCRYLQEFARNGNKDSIGELASLAVALTETLDELLTNPKSEIVESNAKIMRWIAEKLPYWPMLYHRHAAPKKHFEAIAGLLHLSAECPVNVSKSAKYMLQTPINRIVWKCLRHIQQVHNCIAIGEHYKETIEETLSHYIWQRETPIYKQSYILKPLTKSTARQWADKVILPLLRARPHDFYSDAELQAILATRNPKSRKAELTALRKAVIQSLRSLAAKTLG